METEARATTRDLKRQLDLLETAWHNPKITPVYDIPDALDETRRLLARRSLAGWQMAVAAAEPDASRAAARSRSSTGHGRPVELDAAANGRKPPQCPEYFLVEFGGLPETDQALARGYAVEELRRWTTPRNICS